MVNRTAWDGSHVVHETMTPPEELFAGWLSKQIVDETLDDPATKLWTKFTTRLDSTTCKM
jgi:hypothetical protein